jgi:inward rectifier potassium channel
MTFRRKSQAKHRSDRAIWKIEQKDGRNQIVGLNVWHSFWRDPYHLLLTVPWLLLVGILAILYIGINAGFAALYLLVPNSIGGIDSPSFTDAFFFSVQTFAAIGYGVMHPQNLYANIVTTIEAFISLFAIALVTGLIFARFTKSTARILFSKVAIINMHNGVETLMFRAANERRNQILEANLRVVLMRDEISTEGEFMRRFYELKLERNYSPSFTLSWTAIHKIDRDSPLYGCTAESLIQVNAMLIASLSGIDETIANAVHSRHNYTATEILFNSRFVDILSKTTEGISYIDYTRFHDTELIA